MAEALASMSWPGALAVAAISAATVLIIRSFLEHM